MNLCNNRGKNLKQQKKDSGYGRRNGGETKSFLWLSTLDSREAVDFDLLKAIWEDLILSYF